MVKLLILLLFGVIVIAGCVWCFIEAPAIASIGVLAIVLLIRWNMNDNSEY